MISKICRMASLLSYLVVVFLASSSVAYGAPQAVPVSLSQAEVSVPNMSVVESNLYRGGQPSFQDLRSLRDGGVKIDLSLDNEKRLISAEAEQAAALGLKFINIPLSPMHRPSDSEILRFLSVVENKDNEPVFVHCVHGRDRTGTMVALYRMHDEEWSADQAYAEMLKNGFRPFFTSLSASVFDYGAATGRPAHRPSIGFIATHFSGHIAR